MTPHGHHPASRLAPQPDQPPPALPAVTASAEVNAIGQPLPAQQTIAAAVVIEAAQRLEAQQATPAVGPASAGQRAKAGAGSSGAVAEAELVTPPGGFQPGQVWLNNVFSPEMPERPRSEGSTSQYSLICCCNRPNRQCCFTCKLRTAIKTPNSNQLVFAVSQTSPKQVQGRHVQTPHVQHDSDVMCANWQVCN